MVQMRERALTLQVEVDHRICEPLPRPQLEQLGALQLKLLPALGTDITFSPGQAGARALVAPHARDAAWERSAAPRRRGSPTGRAPRGGARPQ